MSRQDKRPEERSPHPAQAAIEAHIRRFEGSYTLTAEFAMDTESIRLFKRENKVVVAFVCTLRDDQGNCLSQGRGLSYIGYQGDRYVQRGILYARNASLIDCAMRASKLSTIFASDEDGEENGQNPGGYHIPVENKPSEKQVSYLKSLAESLPSNEQSDLMTRLPQMTRYDVSQLINSLKTA
jgi:hypothetical protein